MTTSQKQTFAEEFERRWLSRMGTENPYDHNPRTRVGQNEMADWWMNAFGYEYNLALDGAAAGQIVKRSLAKLRRQFPEEAW